MKKAILFTGMLFLSCSTDNNTNVVESGSDLKKISVVEIDLESIVQVKKTTKEFTQTFLMYDIQEITCTEQGESVYEYIVKTLENVDNNVSFNGESVSFSNQGFVLEQNKFYNKQNPSLYLYMENQDLFIYDNYLGYGKKIREIEEFFVDYFILLSVFDELITSDVKYESQSTGGTGPCSFFNQITISGIGYTQAGAAADLQDNICKAYARGGLDGCWVVSSTPQQGTFLGFMDRASVSFCCDGTGPGGATGCW